VAVTADGKRAVSASWDQTLKVWDLESGMALATFTCDAGLHCCTFANAHKIVAGDALGRLHFLLLEEGIQEDARTAELRTASRRTPLTIEAGGTAARSYSGGSGDRVRDLEVVKNR
jgi:hypothetical protein